MFESLQLTPPDPLLSIIEKFNQDANVNKIDLGVGVYKNENNETPVMQCVKEAERWLLANQKSKSYLGAGGDKYFARAMSELAFGEIAQELFDSGRIAALQTPGGCGALRVAAELIMRAKPQAKIWVSDPTWANHIPLLGGAGLTIETYPYYDYESKSIRFDAMCETLKTAAAGDLVLLHGCCHNPCGADLTQSQWLTLSEIMQEHKLIPFIDMAYQGFGENLDADAFGLRHMAKLFPELILAISCSKNFGLYRDRVGLVAVMNETANQATTSMSHFVQIVRGIYSMPPDHGAALVSHILGSSELSVMWRKELDSMRERICGARTKIAEKMNSKGFDEGFSFVKQEKGMFSFLGINADQVQSMADNFGIYMAGSSRINIAGLNDNNLDYFCNSLASTLTAKR